MDRRKELDLEIASEFVQMAAQLIFIKTRMLLSIQDEEALSEMEALMASLEEHQSHENYARIKAVLPRLEQGWKVGQDYMTSSRSSFRRTGCIITPIRRKNYTVPYSRC